MKTNYDIFISYRRTAYDTANLIAEKLRNAGYRVFFDVDTLTSGKFNEQLLEVISRCKDFVLVLPENALDRCKDDGDWIRREVMCAIENGKNIIPVMLDGFGWPQEMPQGMEELPNYQAVTAIKGEYFDMSIERLKGYLKSKSATPMKKWMKRAAITLGILLVLAGIGMAVLHHAASVACEEIAAKETNVMDAVDTLHDISKDIEKNVKAFFSAVGQCKNDNERADLESDLRMTLDKIEKEVDNLQKTMPAPVFKLGTIDSYVLARYDIKQSELDEFSAYYSTLYDDVHNVINLIREVMELGDYSVYNRDMIQTNINCITYSINAYYYGYLSSMSLLPKSEREVYYEHAKKWKHYPNGTPLDLSQDEYEKFQMIEMNKANEEVSQFQEIFNYEDRELNEMEQRLDELEEKIH